MINKKLLIQFEELIAAGKGKDFLFELLNLINKEDKEVKEKYDDLVNQWEKNQASKEFGYLDEQQSIYSFQSVYNRNKEWISNSIIESTKKEEIIIPQINEVLVNSVLKDDIVLRRKAFVGILYIIGGLLIISVFFYPSSVTKMTLIGNQMVLHQTSFMESLWDGGRFFVGFFHLFLGIWYLLVPYGRVKKDILEINDVFSKKLIKLSEIKKVGNQFYYKKRRRGNTKLVLRQVKKDDVNKLHSLLQT